MPKQMSKPKSGLPLCYAHWMELVQETGDCIHCLYANPCLEQQILNEMFEKVC